MYDDDILIIETSEDDEPRNAARRSNRQAAQPARRSRPATRVYRVPASQTRPQPRYRPNPHAVGPIGPQPYYPPMGYPQPGYPQPGYPQPGYSQPTGLYIPPTTAQRSIPLETLAEGTTLAADGIAAILPLPLPPEAVGDCNTDLANQNEHRQALASHTKTTQRIRTGGRILGGLLKMLFTHTR